MSVLRGDCVEVMAGMDADSVDALVTDPPYGLEFMGKEWDRPWAVGFSEMGIPGKRMAMPSFGSSRNPMCRSCRKHQRGTKRCECPTPDFDETPATASAQYETWCRPWATAALRVAKPGAYLLAFGGTRTVHRMTCALEDAGWVIRDMLVWAYAQGFPKSRASLKPAWEPIVLARKPGPLRALNIDAARIGTEAVVSHRGLGHHANLNDDGWKGVGQPQEPSVSEGRWPANVVLTDSILDGGWEGVVGGGAQDSGAPHRLRDSGSRALGFAHGASERDTYPDATGTYSRFFLIPKAPTSERVLSDGRRSPHPTQKPEALIRHLVRLVTPDGGLVLDPFLGSGTLGVVCDGLGMRWVGIERDETYASWAEDRIKDGSPRWLGESA